MPAMQMGISQQKQSQYAQALADAIGHLTRLMESGRTRTDFTPALGAEMLTLCQRLRECGDSIPSVNEQAKEVKA